MAIILFKKDQRPLDFARCLIRGWLELQIRNYLLPFPRKFAGKTIVITGASRGIGREIALKLGQDGANIAIFAKTGIRF